MSSLLLGAHADRLVRKAKFWRAQDRFYQRDEAGDQAMIDAYTVGVDWTKPGTDRFSVTIIDDPYNDAPTTDAERLKARAWYELVTAGHTTQPLFHGGGYTQ